MTKLMLGKLPVNHEAVKDIFNFSDYASVVTLPDPPANFGHEKLIPAWGMLGNDRIGDCYIAGTLHAIMLWNKEAGKDVPFSLKSAVQNYSEITGYKPGPEIDNPEDAGQNPTDRGTDIALALPKWYSTGMVDDNGTRHKIGAYVKLEPGNYEQLKYATRYFDGVGLGIQIPQEWSQEFGSDPSNPAACVWDSMSNPNIEGGHYITSVAWRNGRAVLVTWGGEVEITQAGYEMASDETYAYVTEEKLINGSDLEGLNLAQLKADVKALRSVKK